MAVIGEREADGGQVNLRIHGVKQQVTISIDEFIELLEDKRSSKSLTYTIDAE
jgi:threonyl-tRNA synthetase